MLFSQQDLGLAAYRLYLRLVPLFTFFHSENANLLHLLTPNLKGTSIQKAIFFTYICFLFWIFELRGTT